MRAVLGLRWKSMYLNLDTSHSLAYYQRRSCKCISCFRAAQSQPGEFEITMIIRFPLFHRPTTSTKSSTLPTFFTLSILCIAFPALSQQEDRDPKLTCDAPVYDFGSAKEVEIIKHDFIIRNDGNEPLVIDKVKSSCGCTTASLTTNTLAVGMEMAISAKVVLKKRRGNLVKTIDVISNDPLQPVYTLTVKGIVVVPYSLSPKVATISYTPNEPARPASVRLKFFGDPVQITNTSLEFVDFVTASLEPVVTGREYLVTFNLEEDWPVQSAHSGTFEIMTDASDAKIISVPVALSYFPNIVVAPHEIKIPAVLSKTPFKKRLIVRHRFNKEMEILDIRVPTTNVVATSSKKSPSMHFLVVRIDNVQKALNGTSVDIHVSYDGGKKDVLTVPIKLAKP